jgi:hypothetical protein
MCLRSREQVALALKNFGDGNFGDGNVDGKMLADPN